MSIYIELRAVEDLAGELAALATELADEAHLCRSAAAMFATAADGELAASAAGLGDGWAGLVELMVEGAAAVAESLRAAARQYRMADAEASDRLHHVRAGVPFP